MFEVITGTPQAIASRIGNPKLSRKEGYKNNAAELYNKRAFFHKEYNPGKSNRTYFPIYQGLSTNPLHVHHNNLLPLMAKDLTRYNNNRIYAFRTFEVFF